MKSFGMGALSTIESFELGRCIYSSDFTSGLDGWRVLAGQTAPTFSFNETSASGVDGMLQLVYPSGTDGGAWIELPSSFFDSATQSGTKLYFFKMSIECEGDAANLPDIRVAQGSGLNIYLNAGLDDVDTLIEITGSMEVSLTSSNLFIRFSQDGAGAEFGDIKIRLKDIGVYVYG